MKISEKNTAPALSSSRPRALRSVAARVPKRVKKILLRCYWPLKELSEHFGEYALELVGHVPSHGFRLFFYRAIGRMDIGRETSVHRGCRFYSPKQVHISHNTVINRDVLLDGRRQLVIGSNVSISEGTVILTLEHAVDAPDFALQGGQVTIQDYVFVGAYARILPGVTIGEGAAIGVGAVVTRDVAPYTVVGGVPARYIRERSRDLAYTLRHRKPFG